MSRGDGTGFPNTRIRLKPSEATFHHKNTKIKGIIVLATFGEEDGSDLLQMSAGKTAHDDELMGLLSQYLNEVLGHDMEVSKKQTVENEDTTKH